MKILFNNKTSHIATILVITIYLFSCSKKSNVNISFYYWKTSLYLSNEDKSTLKKNNVKKLYIRYFDIDFDKNKDTAAHPVSIITITNKLQNTEIIPVIYIKNRVFESINPKDIKQLSNNVSKLVNDINVKNSINSNEIQFDCDWTDKTKDKFFLFLKKYKERNSITISSTIRLHQVKYSDKTGIPPVDKGVLMYYNMGEINAGKTNSIYDREIALKYIDNLNKYPLKLDIALPIFTWGIHIRNNNVVQLLNKMNTESFSSKSYFIPIGTNRYRVKQSCFRGGYYFKQNDEIKIESTSESDLKEITKDLRKHLKKSPQEIIFYDLDNINIKQYDKDLFKTIKNSF